MAQRRCNLTMASSTLEDYKKDVDDIEETTKQLEN